MSKLILFSYLVISEINIDIPIKGLKIKIEKEIKNFYGNIANKKNLDALTQKIIELLLKEGYPFAKIKFTSFDIRKNKLIIFIKISNLKPVIIENILLPHELKTKKKIFLRYFPFRKKVFNLEIFKKGKELIERHGIFEIKDFNFKKFKNLNFLYINIQEENNSFFELGTGYDSEQKLLKGEITLNLFNITGNLRKMEIMWKRLKKKDTDFYASYTEPFIGPFEISLNPYYQLSQRDSLFTYQKGGIKISYHFTRVNFSVELGIIEEKPFNNSPINYTFYRNGFEFGRKKYFIEENIYLLIKGSYIKNSERVLKFEGEFNFTKKITDNLYVYFNLIYGYINQNYIYSEIFKKGGIYFPRGYRDEEFLCKNATITVLELHRVFKNISFFLFYDQGFLSLIGKNNLRPAGMGIGIVFKRKELNIKLSFALPYKGELQRTKLHITFRNYF